MISAFFGQELFRKYIRSMKLAKLKDLVSRLGGIRNYDQSIVIIDNNCKCVVVRSTRWDLKKRSCRNGISN